MEKTKRDHKIRCGVDIVVGIRERVELLRVERERGRHATRQLFEFYHHSHARTQISKFRWPIGASFHPLYSRFEPVRTGPERVRVGQSRAEPRT